MSDSANGSPFLEVRNIRKTFGGVVALGSVSFAIPPGAIVGLIGPNGSGKTTLVNVISGLLSADSGEVLLGGRDIAGLPAHRAARLGVARTFQVVRPFTNMTVLENVAVGAMFGSKGVGAAAAMDSARELLGTVGLAGKAEKLADELAIMDRKRLELARALATHPRLLMLDEVLAGLRLGELDEAISLIRTVRQSGVTVLMIEHVLRAIVSLCDNVVVIDRGRKIAEGTPTEVMNHAAVIDAYLGARTAGHPGMPHA